MTHIADRSSATLEPVEVVSYLRTRRNHQSPQLSRRVSSIGKQPLADWIQDVPTEQIHEVFDGDDLAIIRTAYLEACAFLGPNLKQRQKAEIAFSVLSHARRGVRDPHRLALKGIVSA